MHLSWQLDQSALALTNLSSAPLTDSEARTDFPQPSAEPVVHTS